MLANLTWGLMMMLVGMGVVFALLALLMGVLLLIGVLDRPQRAQPAEEPAPALEPAASVPAEPAVRILADGLDENQVAAIAVAVLTHAEYRRRRAAPETRVFEPGSQLFASRWLSIGRGNQNNRFTRR